VPRAERRTGKTSSHDVQRYVVTVQPRARRVAARRRMVGGREMERSGRRSSVNVTNSDTRGVRAAYNISALNTSLGFLFRRAMWWGGGREGKEAYGSDLWENDGDWMTNSAYFADRTKTRRERINVRDSAIKVVWWMARVGWPLYLFGLREGFGVRIRVWQP
jgi:hypothetical protein